jgi:hypothetical protein
MNKLAPLADKILAAHLEKGGSTFNLHGENLAGQDLFAVSIWKSRELRLAGPLTGADIKNFIRANETMLLDSTWHAIGTWTETFSGITYLDVVRLEPNRRHAELLGRQHGQLAICYLKTGEIINL